jgi:hypothetical protein
LRMLRAPRTLSATTSTAGSPRFARDDGCHELTQKQNALGRRAQPFQSITNSVFPKQNAAMDFAGLDAHRAGGS